MIEEIRVDGIYFALIIRRSFERDGIQFFTPQDFSQQLGYMKWGRGHVIPPHAHNEVKRQVKTTNEVLFIRSGRVRVDFYDFCDHQVQSAVLLEGDVILLAEGGHGFEMLEESEMIEVKQGPYAGDQDKRRFTQPTSTMGNCDD